MKMSSLANPTWRTAAILKIVIAPYLSRESPEFYADANFEQGSWNVTKIQKFPNSRWRKDNHFLAITWLHIVRLRRNMEFGGIIARTWREGDENVPFRKSNIAGGRHFENHYISISQPQIVRIARNSVSGHKFYRRQRKGQKNQKFANSKWRMDAALKITFSL